MQRRYQVGLLIVILLANGLIAWGSLTKGHNWGGDFSSYIMQAESILNGDIASFLEDSRFTVTRGTKAHGPVAAPWGLPLLLTPLYAIVGANIFSLKLLNLLCYSLFLIVLWIGIRETISPLFSFLYLALFAFNPLLIQSMNHVIADIPFLFFSTVGIFLIGRVAVDRRVLISRVADHLLLGLLIAFASFIRQTGYLLVITLVLAQIIRFWQDRAVPQDRKYAPPADDTAAAHPRSIRFHAVLIMLLPYLVFFSLTIVWRMIFPENEGHTIQSVAKSAAKLSVSPTSYLDKFVRYIFLAELFFYGVWSYKVVYIATLPSLFSGAVMRMNRDYHFILYLLMTLGLYVLWGAKAQVRYLLPVLPVYIYFVLVKVENIADASSNVRKWAIKAVAVGVLALLVIQFALTSYQAAALNLRKGRAPGQGPYTKTSQEMFAKIRAHTLADDVIVFFKPRVMRFYARRPSITIQRPKFLGRGDYLCLWLKHSTKFQIKPDEVNKLVKSGRLQLKWRNADFAIFHINS